MFHFGDYLMKERYGLAPRACCVRMLRFAAQLSSRGAAAAETCRHAASHYCSARGEPLRAMHAMRRYGPRYATSSPRGCQRRVAAYASASRRKAIFAVSRYKVIC